MEAAESTFHNLEREADRSKPSGSTSNVREGPIGQGLATESQKALQDPSTDLLAARPESEGKAEPEYANVQNSVQKLNQELLPNCDVSRTPSSGEIGLKKVQKLSQDAEGAFGSPVETHNFAPFEETGQVEKSESGPGEGHERSIMVDKDVSDLGLGAFIDKTMEALETGPPVSEEVGSNNSRQHGAEDAALITKGCAPASVDTMDKGEVLEEALDKKASEASLKTGHGEPGIGMFTSPTDIVHEHKDSVTQSQEDKTRSIEEEERERRGSPGTGNGAVDVSVKQGGGGGEERREASGNGERTEGDSARENGEIAAASRNTADTGSAKVASKEGKEGRKKGKEEGEAGAEKREESSNRASNGGKSELHGSGRKSKVRARPQSRLAKVEHTKRKSWLLATGKANILVNVGSSDEGGTEQPMLMSCTEDDSEDIQEQTNASTSRQLPLPPMGEAPGTGFAVTSAAARVETGSGAGTGIDTSTGGTYAGAALKAKKQKRPSFFLLVRAILTFGLLRKSKHEADNQPNVARRRWTFALRNVLGGAVRERKRDRHSL